MSTDQVAGFVSRKAELFTTYSSVCLAVTLTLRLFKVQFTKKKIKMENSIFVFIMVYCSIVWWCGNVC